jgi:hypothetical protein
MNAATDPIEVRARELATASRLAGHLVSLEGYVSESCVAELIGVAESTLRDWRGAGRYPLHHRRFGGARGKVQYDLRSVAAFLLAAEAAET